MKNRILTVLMWMATVWLANAQAVPDVRLYTNIYATDGPTNSFTLVLGAAPGCAGYVDVVCSGGNQSEANIAEAYFDSTNEALVGTNISCQVNEEGYVDVFCDEGVVIEYLCANGAEITSIEFKNPESIVVLDLEHNALESLDLSAFINLQALYLGDNPFDKSPLVVGKNKPLLTILDLSIIEHLDPDFDIKYYPNLQSFDALCTHDLKNVTPAYCPKLKKLSIDNTSVETLDLANNPELLILNISETRISEIDLKGCPHLQQLYVVHQADYNSDIKLKNLDVTNNPELIYLFANGNDLTSLDLSNCPYLLDLYVRQNHLTGINLDNNTQLINVYLTNNNMDFNTLPIPQQSWGSYDYGQRPLEVPQSYLVGTPLDLSSRVKRTDSETYATVFSSSDENPGIYTEVDGSAYTYSEGVITFNEVVPDSVFVSFYNSTFPDIELSTTMFKVKDASTYGADDKMVSISTTALKGARIKMYIGVAGATADTPKTFYVDLGDGVKQEFVATTDCTPQEPNVDVDKPAFGAMIVYVPEGERLTSFKMEDFKINSIDLTGARHLTELTLKDTKLKKIDLQWNNLLRSLELSGNTFGEDLTLAGANGGYTKNLLSHIVLSDNGMTSVKLNEPATWRYLDLSHNNLTDFNFTDADSLQYLDISHNALAYLKVNYCEGMHTLLCNDNHISSMVLPEVNNIKYLDCSNNAFGFATLPDRNGLGEDSYIYAPQSQIAIPDKGPGYNLSAQYTMIEGCETQFVWKTTAGEALVEGVDYVCDKGITHFDDCTIGKTLYCEMTHNAYPALSGENALRTTQMLSAGMPSNLLGSFNTPVGGQEVRLSVAADTPNTALYIDWTGTESLEQYPMTSTYTVYSPVTTEGASVKVWSYEKDELLTVFSLSGATITDADFSNMRTLTTFSLNDAGISSGKMPQSQGLKELSMDNNAFDTFDFGAYPDLVTLSLVGNQLTEADLSGCAKLQVLNLSNNQLSSVHFANNNELWGLGLSNNCLSDINFDGAPNLYQVFVNNNQLSAIDLDALSQLRVVYLDHNQFDFSNLPLPRDQWSLYIYGNQKDIEIESGHTVDLSHLAERDGTPTVFTWFFGTPSLDESTGEITGEELYVDDEYEIVDGVTTFKANIDRTCCVLTNALFPDMYMITNIISAVPASIQSVAADKTTMDVSVVGSTVTITSVAEGTRVSMYCIDGRRVADSVVKNGEAVFNVTTPGIYLITTGYASSKVIVK